MQTTLSAQALATALQGLTEANRALMARYPGESGRRQPVHSFYGGAHLFRADTAQRLGSLALESMDRCAPDADTLAHALEIDPALSARIYDRVREKLRREPVEDYRIDFEDGYGNRPDAEEDQHAKLAAEEVAKGFRENTLPPFIGIRLKPFSLELR